MTAVINTLWAVTEVVNAVDCRMMISLQQLNCRRRGFCRKCSKCQSVFILKNVVLPLILHHNTLPHLIPPITLSHIPTIILHQLFLPLYLTLPYPILFPHVIIYFSHSHTSSLHPLIIHSHYHCLGFCIKIPSKPAPRIKWLKYTMSMLLQCKVQLLLQSFNCERKRIWRKRQFVPPLTVVCLSELLFCAGSSHN